MNNQNYQIINDNIILKNLFISEIFKFTYLMNINKKIYKLNKQLGLAYTLSESKIIIGKNILDKLNIDLLLIQSKIYINIHLYLYKINNKLYTIAYNYILNKVISIYIN